MRFPRRVARRAAAVAALLVTAGCSSLQPVPVAYINETRPAIVHVSDGFGVVTTIANPRVSGDTVVGTTLGGAQPVAVPLREVQRVSAVRRNSGRTAMLIAGIAGAGALMTYAVIANGARSDYTCDYNEPTLDGSEREKCGFNP